MRFLLFEVWSASGKDAVFAESKNRGPRHVCWPL